MSATLPAPPGMALHLADASLYPILSSSTPSTSPRQPRNQYTQYPRPRQPPPPQLTQHEALTSLSQTGLQAYTYASRLGLGIPQRILVETREGGPVVTQGFLDPAAEERRRVQDRARASQAKLVLDRVYDSDDTVLSPGQRPHGDGNGGGANGDARGDGAGEGEEEEVEYDGFGQPLPPTPSMGRLSMADEIAHGSGHYFSDQDDRPKEPQPPLLVGTVVARDGSHIRTSQRAVQKLEGLGREFQERWKEGHAEREARGTNGGGEVSYEEYGAL